MINTRKNIQQSPTVKLDLWLIEPQNLSFGSHTSNFKFETFDGNEDLHLPPPNLLFRVLQKPAWYAGIPLNILIFASNLRPQAITNSTFDVSISSNNRIIYNNQSSLYPVIASQHSVTFPLRFSPHEPTSNFRISVKLNYMLESMLQSCSILVTMQIYHSILCKATYQEGFVGYTVENVFPFPISSVRFSNGEIVADKLMVNEKVNGFVQKSTAFEVNWSLPYANDCSLVYPPIQKNAEKMKKLSIHIITSNEENLTDSKSKLNLKQISLKVLPKILPIMTPFDATLKLKNKINESISGSLALLNEENLAILGEDSIHFQLEPKEIKFINITFIGLKEGTIQFPDFIATYNEKKEKDPTKLISAYINKFNQDSNVQNIQIKAGIILIGNNN